MSEELPTAWANGWECPVTHGYKSEHPDGSVGYWPACDKSLIEQITYEFRTDVDVSIIGWE